jgi:hypothetical protein
LPPDGLHQHNHAERRPSPCHCHVDGELEGRTFSDFCWLPPSPSKITPGQTQLLRLGTCLLGRDLTKGEIATAAQVIQDGIGDTVVNLRVFRTISKKNGQTYVNIRYTGRVDEPQEADNKASNDA